MNVTGSHWSHAACTVMMSQLKMTRQNQLVGITSCSNVLDSLSSQLPRFNNNDLTSIPHLHAAFHNTYGIDDAVVELAYMMYRYI